MQNRQPQKSRPRKVGRVYASRSSHSRSHEENTENDGLEDPCAPTSTSCEIDLPIDSLDAAVTSLTQTFSFDQDVELVAKSNDHLSKPGDNLTSVFGLCNSEFTVTEDGRFTSFTEIAKNVATQTFFENAGSPSETTTETEISDDNNHRYKKIPTKDESSSGTAKHVTKLVSSTDNVANYVQRGSVEVASFRSTETLKRPQFQVSGFMEDHAEFSSDWRETAERQGGRYTPSVLESTVDGSVVKGARRMYGSRVSSADLNNFIDMAIQIGSVEKDPLIALDEWGLKTEQHKYKCSACELMSKTRSDIEQHIAIAQKGHEEAVVVVLIGPEARGRSCPLCDVRLQRTHLFKHIRESHSTFFPLRCGYCVFMGQDHNQLRHHIRKKHGTSKYHIIDVSSILAEDDKSGERLLLEEEEQGDELSTEDPSHPSHQENMYCPICKKGLKTLRNLKKHVVQHSQQKQQCVLCSFTTTFPTQIRSHFRRKHPTHAPQWQKVMLEQDRSGSLVEDVGPYLRLITTKYGVRQPKKEKKWMRQYRCPHCDYTCSFNSSYNRHLRLHNGVKPHKCGYCDFHGREAYVVRKHCLKMHKGKEPIIESDKNFKAPYRYDSRTRKGKCEEPPSCDDGQKNHSIASDLSSQQTLVAYKEEAIAESALTNATSASSVVDHEDEKLFYASPSASFAKKFECLTFKTLSVMGEDQTDNNADVCQEQHKMKNIEFEQISKRIVPNQAIYLEGTETLNTLNIHSSDYDTQYRSTRLTSQLLKEECSLQNNIVNNVDIAAKLSLQENTNKDRSSNHELCNVKRHAEPQPENQSIRVKTIKVKHSPQNKSLRDGCVLPQNKLTTSLVSETYKSSFCSVTSGYIESDEASENTVVIELWPDENDCFTLREVTNLKNKEEQKQESLLEQNSMDLVPIETDLRREDLLPVSVSNPTTTQSSNTDDNITVNNDKIIEPAVLKKGDGLIQAGSLKIEETEGKPSSGLESTLHTHIAFLTDSLVQRLSSPISATPGVMTRDLLGLDYSNNDYFSSEKVRMMMKKKSGGRVKCSVCGVTTTYRAFYKHAKKHFHIKPFKCGYCSYRSIEKSKIRVHNTFCHPSQPCVILKLSPETAGVTTEEGQQTPERVGQPDGDTATQKELKSGDSNLTTIESTNIPSSSSNTFIKTKPSNGLPTTVDKKINRVGSRHPLPSTSSSGPSTFQCPICHKHLQIHTPSIRRHLYSHYGYKPYKCGYCTFTAIGQNEIRAHHVTHGFTTVPKVESSGVAMPAGLAPYINELLGQQRGHRKPQKKRGQVDQVEEATENGKERDNAPEPNDLMWTEMDTSKEELTTIYFTPQDSHQQTLDPNGQQECLEDLSVGANHLTDTLESVDLSSEAAYAVQVLESGQNSAPSGSPTGQLDLNPSQSSYTQFSSDQVCVVYLID